MSFFVSGVKRDKKAVKIIFTAFLTNVDDTTSLAAVIFGKTQFEKSRMSHTKDYLVISLRVAKAVESERGLSPNSEVYWAHNL